MTDSRGRFGANLASLRQTSGCTRSEFCALLSGNLTGKERRILRAHVKNAEERQQRRSVLIEPLSRVFGIPVRALTTEDLVGMTLDQLRERFGFDPAEVRKRAADFHY